MTAPPLLHSLALGPRHLGGTDVTLACEDGALVCHAALLAAASPLLRYLLHQDAERHTLLLPGTSTSLLRHLQGCQPADESGFCGFRSESGRFSGYLALFWSG